MPSVLFVCVANSFRSQMAEAFATMLGKGQWEVWSAGSNPSGIVHPLAMQLMAERGCELRAQYSKGLEDVPAHRWDYVVTMGCGDRCPAVPAAQHLEWQIPDPAGRSPQEVRRIRDRIESLVRDLLNGHSI